MTEIRKTFRISEEDQNFLDRITDELHCSTENAAIKEILRKWESKTISITALKHSNKQLEERIRTLENKNQQYKDFFDSLKGLLDKD